MSPIDPKDSHELTRRKFLVESATAGTAVLAGLYVTPTLKSVGIPAAYAAGSSGGGQCVLLTVAFDDFPEAARLHDGAITTTHKDILKNAYCIEHINVTKLDDTVHPFGAMVFDSAAPTGGDTDLETPGYHPTNTTAQGKILIIQEDGTSTPDDDAAGGKIIFEFSSPLDVLEVHVLDIDEDENTFKSWVKTYDPFGSLISTVGMEGLGDNSFQKVIETSPT